MFELLLGVATAETISRNDFVQIYGVPFTSPAFKAREPNSFTVEVLTAI